VSWSRGMDPALAAALLLSSSGRASKRRTTAPVNSGRGPILRSRSMSLVWRQFTRKVYREVDEQGPDKAAGKGVALFSTVYTWTSTGQSTHRSSAVEQHVQVGQLKQLRA